MWLPKGDKECHCSVLLQCLSLSVFDLETPLSVLMFVWGPFGIMIVCCFILQVSFISRSFFLGGGSGLSVSSFELFILGSVITGEGSLDFGQGDSSCVLSSL